MQGPHLDNNTLKACVALWDHTWKGLWLRLAFKEGGQLARGLWLFMQNRQWKMPEVRFRGGQCPKEKAHITWMAAARRLKPKACHRQASMCRHQWVHPIPIRGLKWWRNMRRDYEQERKIIPKYTTANADIVVPNTREKEIIIFDVLGTFSAGKGCKIWWAKEPRHIFLGEQRPALQ